MNQIQECFLFITHLKIQLISILILVEGVEFKLARMIRGIL